MAHFTAYLLGKVQLDGAIGSEVLANIVETLLHKYTSSSAEGNAKKQIKFQENLRYTVECTERGLKLTSPGFKSKDEGFESDSESIPSIKINEPVEIDLAELMDHLEITKEEKETDSGTHHLLSSLSSGTSMDNTSISSSSNINVLDDSNSSSGNGSDSDEFSSSPLASGERSPYWENLPNLSSFHTYPIQDVVFCHCDSTLHPSTLVWVIRQHAKMIALVTAFRSRNEAEQIFQSYREVRIRVRTVKHKMNMSLGNKIVIPSAPESTPPPPPTNFEPNLSVTNETSTFTSLPPVYLTEVLPETSFKSPMFSTQEAKSLDFDYGFTSFKMPDSRKDLGFGTNEGAGSRFGSAFYSSQVTEAASFLKEGFKPSKSNPNEVEENSEDEDVQRVRVPVRAQRKLHIGVSKSSAKAGHNKPVLLVPLKTESLTTSKSSYPKESYLYHVMGRSSSTFAPYQRSLNFAPACGMGGSGPVGTEYMSWANTSGKHLLVPFSSWLELSDLNHSSQSSHPKSVHASSYNSTPRLGKSRRGGNSTISSLQLNSRGTAKILLRDSSGNPGMWTTLSQRVKRNFRENLIPKLNGMWTQPGSDTGTLNTKIRKKCNKKVTFNNWATVQMV